MSAPVAPELLDASRLIVECPECAACYELPAAAAGRQARCAECGGVFRVGAAAAELAGSNLQPAELPAELPILELDVSELIGGYWQRVFAGKFSGRAMLISVALHVAALVLLSLWFLQPTGLSDRDLSAAFGMDELTEFEDELPSDLMDEPEPDVALTNPLEPVVDVVHEFNLEAETPDLPGPNVDDSGTTGAAGREGGGLSGVDAAIARAVSGRVKRAGGQTGAVQFSLAWESMNDLDLHVQTPRGIHLYYGNRQAASGMLDVDMNVQPESSEPVENVFFSRSDRGTYVVYIDHFKHHQNQPTTDAFVLRAMIDGRESIHRGKISAGGRAVVFEFEADIAPEALPYRVANARETRAAELLERMLAVRDENPRLAEGLRLRILRDYPSTKAAESAAREKP